MSDWSGGYVVDIPYSTGFYRELTPTWLNFTALLNGNGAPAAKGFHYAELGCGLGHGTALMAATHPDGQFYGFDFNPEQIGIASRLASAAGLSNMHFLERSFEELAQDGGALPQFDYIVMHGIWTWVSEANRKHALAFVAKHLKPNGIVYVSYNCNVGWTGFAPLQQFMRAYAATLPGASDQRSRAVFNMAKSLSDGGAMYFQANPQVDRRIAKAVGQDGRYLAHEYLNGNWYLPGHAEVRADFALAKCDYLGSATLPENYDSIMLPAGVREQIGQIEPPALREAARDLACNKAFRRDLYMRGAHRLTPQELNRAWSAVRLLPLSAPKDGKIKVRTAVGELAGQDDFYGPLLDALFSRGSLGFAEAQALPAMRGRGAAELQQAFALLVHAEAAHPEAAVAAAQSAAQFNRAAYAQLVDGHELSFFALPRHGSGLGLPFFQAVLAQAMRLRPDASDAALAAEVWSQYQLASRRPARDGKPILDPSAALAALAAELTPAVVAERRAAYTIAGLLD